MAEVGAELHTLKSAHSTFKDHSQRVLDSKSAIDNAVHSAIWKGKNADEFRNQWQEYRSVFDKVHESLTKAHEDVRVQHNNIAAATGEPDHI